MVMVHLFKASGFKFGIAHCNFKLRGTESDQDAIFVGKAARHLDVEYFEKSFETLGFADKKKLSIQEAARELRYLWFDQLIDETSYKYYATAHHFDDQIETFFINLFRGTGTAGLRGIRPKNKACVRPMLFAKSADIERFAREKGIQFREDSSNFGNKYLRNKIRHHLIPTMENINPGFRKGFEKTFEIIRETDDYIQKSAKETETDLIIKTGKNNLRIPTNRILQLLPESKILLFEILRQFGFNYSTLNNIINSLNNPPGQKFYAGDYQIIRDRDSLYLSKRNEANQGFSQEKITIEHNTAIISEPVQISFEIIERDSNFQIQRNKTIAQMDFDKLVFPLTIRKPKTGDYFSPIGMTGRKKLSDFFTDEKFSHHQKMNTWILTSKNNIAWIIGHRIDNRVKIDHLTKVVFMAVLKQAD